MPVLLNNLVPQAGDLVAGVSATSQWRLERLELFRGWSVNGLVIAADVNASYINVGLIGEYGRRRRWGYVANKADGILLALNKANLSAGQPLEYRVLNQLILDAVEAGNLTGAAD